MRTSQNNSLIFYGTLKFLDYLYDYHRAEMRTAPVIQIIFHILSTILGLYSAKSPHIVFILSDDVGWNDFSLHGSQQCKTPYIDELASDSVILDNYYTMSVCSPTRASLLTGRHVTHTGIVLEVSNIYCFILTGILICRRVSSIWRSFKWLSESFISITP